MPAMAPTSSGLKRRSKKTSKKRKSGTENHRSHRFVPFSRRIEKLKIDPIRRVQQTDLDLSNSDSLSSFRVSLDKWRGLNLSENFSSFARESAPLCDTLVQIIHHEDKLVDLMAEYIGRKDVNSLEPLLDLLAHFVQDLGQRFEKHFLRAVSLVASVASSHPDIEVIEWSFSCLAYMFKFLSRLLVPDLRPTLEIMLPYLGKTKQKGFVVRFAAESMSYLIRKAGAKYRKDKIPLKHAVLFLLNDIQKTENSPNWQLYAEGLMTLFSEAIRGVQGGLYSAGPSIVDCILEVVFEENFAYPSAAGELAAGTLTNVIHHTNAETFLPLLDIIVEKIAQYSAEKITSSIALSIHMLVLVTAARRGSRIRDWKKIIPLLMEILDVACELSDECPNVAELFAAIAKALQECPMDQLLPFMRPLMDAVVNRSRPGQFLGFCALWSELESDRFESIILPYLQKFITAHWTESEDGLAAIFRQFPEQIRRGSADGVISPPLSWQQHIVLSFDEDHLREDDVAKLYMYTNVMDVVAFGDDINLDISSRLRSLILRFLQPNAPLDSALCLFALGPGFQSYARLMKREANDADNLWPQLLEHGPQYIRLPSFLEGLVDYGNSFEPSKDLLSSYKTFLYGLTQNLALPSHEIRLSSLRLLSLLSAAHNLGAGSAISIALELESSPLNIQTVRTMSMNIRRLTACYNASWPSPMNRLIPAYCMGLLSMRSAQIYQDVCECLKVICENVNAEQVVADVIFPWLQQETAEETGGLADKCIRNTLANNDFQCSSLRSLLDKVNGSFQEIAKAGETYRKLSSHALTLTWQAPKNARSQSLRVLNAIPHVAERRSRQFVPHFLSWASQDNENIGNVETSTKSSVTITAEEPTYQWSLADRKLMLGVFGEFRNPKVLYKSDEVYDSLLDCLSNGDKDIQKAALNALFTWKKPSIRPYEHNLLNLLDDARFSDELSIFLHDGLNETVSAYHRGELMPLLLRLLYGKLVSRKGSHSNQNGQDVKRKAVLRSLARLEDKDFALFVRIAFGSLSDVHLITDGKVVEQCLAYEFVPMRKQYGLLKMIDSMLGTLGTRLEPFAEQMLNATLYCLIRSCRIIAKDAVLESDQKSRSALAKSLRHIGIHIIDLLFATFRQYDFSGYRALVFAEVVNPRLENFAAENSQGVSGLLHLFGTWASATETAFFLVDMNESLLKEVTNCVIAKGAQETVRVFVLEQIWLRLVGFLENKNGMVEEPMQKEMKLKIFDPNIDHVLGVLGHLLQDSASRSLTDSAVQIFSGLTTIVSSTVRIENLVSVILYVVRQSSERVSPKSKSGLIRSLTHLLPHIFDKADPRLVAEVYKTVASQFNFFRDRSSREVLCEILLILASADPELSEVATLCTDLNSYSHYQLDSFDFERCLGAFAELNENSWAKLSPLHWRPVLFNLLYFVKNEDEMAIRASAAFSIRRFIDAALHAPNDDFTEFGELTDQVLIPSLQNGMKLKAEVVRAEMVALLGYLVKKNPISPILGGLHPLLVNEDEEASFFSNILHIQQHRRLRALRRLANETSKGRIHSHNISRIFLPLIEHFIFDALITEDAHNLTSEAIYTVGVLAEWLEWPQFRALYGRYKGVLETKLSMEKSVIKLWGSATDALCRAVSRSKTKLAPQDMMDAEDKFDGSISTLAQTLPSTEVMTSELVRTFLPFLTGFIHNKDESQLSMRIPVAVSTTKIVKLLLREQANQFIPPILLDVSSILRSKAQESRDLARKTLAEMALILGPTFFGFVLKELKSALPRGTQLHVLSYTVHSLLVVTADSFNTGDLDYCLSDIVSIVVEDVFGSIGEEKDAEGFTSKMKEVKSHKSFDTMELLAKHSSITCLRQLILPVHMVLEERINAKSVKKADELLRRISVGVLRNQNSENRDLLVLCYEVLKDAHSATTEASSSSNSKTTPAIDRFIVQPTPANKALSRISTTSHLFKVQKFALDLLRAALQKYSRLNTPENVAGIIPIISDCLLQPHEEIKVAAVRLIATVIRLPLISIDRNATTYVAEAMKLVKGAPDTSHDSAQAALKLVTAILRERKNVQLREGDLSYLLSRLKSDLEEPDRQGVTFNFIKAVLARKVMIAEVYDLMDTVSTMMITNHNKGARDLARGAYLQFLIHYPQGKRRWSKQLAFLVKNMSYEHQEGRMSVLEAVHLILYKFGDDLVQEVVDEVYIPILMVIANDDAAECREMGAALLGEIFGRADQEHTQTFVSLLRTWIVNAENSALQVLGLQAYRIFFDSKGASAGNEVAFILKNLQNFLQADADEFSDGQWERKYFALQLFAKVSKMFPDAAMSTSCDKIWRSVKSCLTYPHAWVKQSAASLFGIYLADLAKANATTTYGTLPLIGCGGLLFKASDMVETMRATLRVLKTPNITEDLATQSIKNLVFLGRCFAANRFKIEPKITNGLLYDATDDEDDGLGEETEELPQKTALLYMFERLSSILRKEPVTTRAPSLIPKTATLRLIASLCNHLDQDNLRPYLPTILLPLQILTDPNIPAPRSTDEEFLREQKNLISSSQDILDLFQEKVGTTVYVAEMTLIKEDIKQRREGRRIKRRINAVADPEKSGRDKKRKNERQKMRRKEIGAEQRIKRQTRG